MLRSFLSRLRRGQSEDFPPPLPYEPFIAIGDIHGRYDLLEIMADALANDYTHIKRWVFVGDYIDRGENSAEVLRWLHQAATGWEGVICLRGNHEDMLLDFLEDPALNGPFWLQNGGLSTLASYGLAPVRQSDPPEDWLDLRDRLQSLMGADLIAWLRALPARWRSGNVVCVHAGVDPRVPIDAQDDHDLIWGHRAFFRQPREDGIWVVHGHTIVDDVLVDAGRVSIDTGAFATGRLSGVIVRERRITPMTSRINNKVKPKPL